MPIFTFPFFLINRRTCRRKGTLQGNWRRFGYGFRRTHLVNTRIIITYYPLIISNNLFYLFTKQQQSNTIHVKPSDSILTIFINLIDF